MTDTPLRLAADNTKPEMNPEILLISALIDSGTYNPGEYGVHNAAFTGFKQLHNECLAHQEAYGAAPALNVIAGRYPSFTHVPNVVPQMAADEMKRRYLLRKVTNEVGLIAAAISDGAADEALNLANRMVESAPVGGPKPIGLSTALEHMYNQATSERVPVPSEALMRVTGGGIPPGSVWLISAASNVGKTNLILNHTWTALLAGWDIYLFSLEATSADIAERLATIALRDTGLAAKDLTLEQLEVEMNALMGPDSGSLNIIARSNLHNGEEIGDLDINLIRSMVKSPRALVVIDYVNLMSSPEGGKEEFSRMEAVAKGIQRYALTSGRPVLAASQLNRDGQLAGSEWFFRIADVVLKVEAYSATTRKNIVTKNRRGPKPVYFSLFNAEAGLFYDIEESEAEIRKERESRFSS